MDTTQGLGYVLSDAAIHFGFGVGVALADYSKIHLAPKKERIAEKKETLETISRILNSQPESVATQDAQAGSVVDKMDLNSTQYAQNIAELKDYFIHTKVFKEENPGFFKTTKEYLKNWHKEERLNTSTSKAKFWTAVGIELLVDSPMALANFHGKAIESGLQGRSYSFGFEILKNVWEIPAFYFGLEAGNKLKYAIKPFVETGEERKLANGIRSSIKKTNIVDIVFNYVPPTRIVENLEEDERKKFGVDINFTRAGKRILRAIGKPKEYIQNASAERKAKYEKQREDLKKRFEDVTKNY